MSDWLRVCFVGFWSACVCGLEITESRASGAVEKPQRRLSAWLTLANTPEGIASAEAGLRLWGRSGLLDEVVLHASPMWVGDVLPDLVAVCAEYGLPVVPALSAAAALERRTGAEGTAYWVLDDIAGWERVSDAITTAARITASRRVGLDLELATKGYRYGQAEVDLDRFARAVRQLPKGVELIVRPTVTDGDVDRRRRQEGVLLTLLAEHGNVSFISQSHASVWAFGHSRRNRAYMAGLNAEWYPGQARPRYQYLWLFGIDSKYLQDDEGLAMMVGIPSTDVVVLYLGASRWVERSERWIELLTYAQGHDD